MSVAKLTRPQWLYATAITFLTSSIVYESYTSNKTLLSMMDDRLNLFIVANGVALGLWFVTKLVIFVLLGQLHESESGDLISMMLPMIAESLLTLTLFRASITPQFSICFVLLMPLKIMHKTLTSRVERLSELPTPGPTVLAHARVALTSLALAATDIASLYLLFTRQTSFAARLVFAPELVLSVIAVINSGLLHLLTSYTQASTSSLEFPTFPLRNLALVIQVIDNSLRCAVHLPALILCLRDYGLPLHIVRDAYLTSKNAHAAFTQIQRSRTASMDLDKLLLQNNLLFDEQYEEPEHSHVASDSAASDEEADLTCLVCREDISPDSFSDKSSSPESPALLPCGHLFHLQCLHLWVERQQTCPTCRAKIRPASPGSVPMSVAITRSSSGIPIKRVPSVGS
ncbi:hypothetical protein SISSUDRAFT_1052076 [Sistotremastrum suecicum HHB10207 ss-3]|uniref:RING-type E3 ubiquitin transferase n=1 Tax=Sistotremastrum suecicum HHB10207 ss-3 TaxID=1314776 RepID=A0A166A4Z9_9AGAM|nr:hypothetical protein SISSUDRAFT_1052076 [Sistotremastrum suecicum HHB10207 ss-3]